MAVGDFFGDHANDSDINKWNSFHIENREKCRGLRMLTFNLFQLGGWLWVKTSTDYDTPSGRFLYYRDFRRPKSISPITGRHMPGAQLSIVYSLTNIKSRFLENSPPAHNSEQELQDVGYQDGDSTFFAECIDYEAVPVLTNLQKLLDDLGNNSLTRDDDQKRKLEVVRGCADKLTGEMNALKSIQVAYVNLKHLTASDQRAWEIFSKGLLLSMIRSEKEFRLALVHVTEKNRDRILDILVSDLFAYLYSRTSLDRSSQIAKIDVHAPIRPNFKGFKDMNLLAARSICESKLPHCVQLYIYGKDKDDGVKETLLLGSSIAEMVFNAEQYGFIRGYVPAQITELAKGLEDTHFRIKKNPINAVPFDVILPVEIEREQTLFDDYIDDVTEKDITNSDGAGYKLSQTHMRLGSKVHLEDFYEASLLFQKPRIANRIALQILRHLERNNCDLDLYNTHFVLYGYASYSRLILSMLVEILSSMRGGATEKLDFVVYQNDLVNSGKDSDTKLYFSRQEGAVSLRQPLLDGAKVLQIVPISSTLSTFKKMWSKFQEEVGLKKEKNIISYPYANYTLFWVHAEAEANGAPTKLEERYWESIHAKPRKIKTKIISPDPVFFVEKAIEWYNPEGCPFCYPPNPLDELPLIETDATSTVPIIQFDRAPTEEKPDVHQEKKNQRRLMKLKACILAGHIQRGSNHFQYSVDTGHLFLEVRDDIRQWLESKRKKSAQERTIENRPSMHVIVTPDNQSTVEFFQYVHRYYFGGNADVIIIDPMKEYRSNFETKYAGVKCAVANAYQRGYTVKWHFVDVSIASGTSFWRSNSLIHSLIQSSVPSDVQLNSIIFDDIFLLVNRLSKRSKGTYNSDPEKNFHSFIDIYLSTMRSNGGLCIGCNLQKMTERLQKRSATQHVYEYLMKTGIGYRPIPFDKWDYQWGKEEEDRKVQSRKKAYFRLVCSHLARLHIDEYPSSELGKKDTLLKVLRLFGEVVTRAAKTHPQVATQLELLPVNEDLISIELLDELRKNQKFAVESYIKVLTRPFFSLKKTLACCCFDLCLAVADSMLDMPVKNDKNSITTYFNNKFKAFKDKKRYLNDNEIIDSLTNLVIFLNDNYQAREKVNFLSNVVFEALCDLRSNYLIRTQTLKKVLSFLEDYWESSEDIGSEKRDTIINFLNSYTILIQRLVNNSSDEAKSLWLDTLLAFGHEGNITSERDCERTFPATELQLSIPDDYDWNCNEVEWVRTRYRSFLYDVFLENSRVYYEGIRDLFGHLARVAPETLKNPQILKNPEEAGQREALNDTLGLETENYFLDNLVRLIDMSFPGNSNVEKTITAEGANILWGSLHLYQLLNKNESQDTTTQDRYNCLKSYLERISNSDVTILTLYGDFFFNVVNPSAVVDDTTKGDIKTAQASLLNKKGYHIGRDFILIKLHNSFEFIDKEIKESRIFKHTLVPILPVYLYLKGKIQMGNMDKLHAIRRVLSFRTMLIRWIEKDFNNNAIPAWCATQWESLAMSRQKALDHTSYSDLFAARTLLQRAAGVGTENEEHYARLVFLKLYTNQMIARIYRDHVKDGDAGYPKNEKHSEWNKKYGYCDENESNNRFNKTLRKLGDAFFGETFKDGSRVNYFKLLNDYFEIEWTVGVKRKTYCLLDLHAPLNRWDCLCSDTRGYRSEEMTCLILDILFSAIRNSPERQKEKGDDINIVDQFKWYADNKKRCKIQVSAERADGKFYGRTIHNLIFKCETWFKNKDKATQKKAALRNLEAMNKQDKGISLLAMKWYIEGLEKILYAGETSDRIVDSNNNGAIIVQYDYIDEGQDWYLLEKLPIFLSPL
ncbi:hypothetical protein LJC22_04625 [Desulfosarcina sp. OttesenSCG-928-G10]|nr:hypothetical protein [Desulfosarcina sp. OttesenSCG-928-G10]